MHPAIIHLESKQTCMNLPNRLELSLRTVLAFPETPQLFLFTTKKTVNFTESFQYRVGFEDLLLNPRGHAAGHRAQILQDETGIFRFSSAAFTRYDQTLIDLPSSVGVHLQGNVSRFCQSEDVWVLGAQFLAVIFIHIVLKK